MADEGFSFEDAITPPQPQQAGFSYEDAVAPSSAPQQSDSQYLHQLGQSPNANFPNVKEEGMLPPREVTYNPDGTIDSTRVDAMAPLRHFATGIGDLYQSAENKSIDETPEELNALVALSGMPSVARGAANALGDVGERAATALGPLPTEFVSTAIPPKFPGSSDTQKALFQSHTDALTHDNDLFNWRDDMAQGKQVSVPDLKDTLTGVINDAKSQVANPQVESSAITKLNKINQRISDDGVVPLDALTDLDRYFNSLPKRAYTDSPINGIARGSVKTAIDKAAQTFPEFGDAHYAANDFHTNMKNEFENSVLDPIYNPDDTQNLNMYFNGKTRTPNAETQQRGENLMENVYSQGITGFNQVKSLLPNKAAQDAFTDEFLNYVKNKDGNGRMAAVKSLISDPFTNTGRKIFDIASPQYNADTKGFLSAQKGEMPYDYANDGTPFSSFMGDSKQSLAEQKAFQKSGGYGFSMTGNRQLPAPNTPLLLDSHKPVYVQDTATGEQRPMTDDELAIHNMSPAEQAKRVQKVPQQQPIPEIQQMKDVRDSARDWDVSANNLSTQGYSALEIQNKIGKRPVEPVIPQDYGNGVSENTARMKNISDWDNNYKTFQDAGYTHKDIISKIGNRPEVPTFKRGGVVPSDAQKEAGNYKKDHIKIHGLDISIENPK